MSDQVLDMDCTSYMLDFLPETKVWEYGQAIPSAKEAVDSYWKRKKKIVIDKISPDNAKKLLHVVKLTTNLKELTFLKHTNEDIHALRKLPTIIATNCTNIEILHLNDIFLYKEQLLTLCQCTKLRELSINCIAKDYTLKTLFSCLPRLEELSLQDNSFLITLRELIRGDCLFALPKTIKRLKLVNTYQINSEKFTQAVVAFKNLEVLSICGLRGPAFIPGLIPSLTTLSVSIPQFDHLNTVINCTQLTKLHINVGIQIENNIVIAIIDNCVLLEDLQLFKLSTSFTANQFGHFANLPKLQILKLSGDMCCYYCSQHTECMSNLSKCKNLRVLYVKTCGLTNQAALQIIEHCEKLSLIEIDHCYVTTDLAVMTIDILQNQINRETVLGMNFYNTRRGILSQKEQATHPLLKVTHNFYQRLIMHN